MELLRVFSFRPIVCRQALSCATLLLVPDRESPPRAATWPESSGYLEAGRALATPCGRSSFDILHSNSLPEFVLEAFSILQARRASSNLSTSDLAECAPGGFVLCRLDWDYY